MSREPTSSGAKVNRSRAEVGREVTTLLQRRDVVCATRADSPYDVRVTGDDEDALPESAEGLLAPKVNRSRTEVGRAVFRAVENHGTVFVTRGEDDFDVQLYPATE